MKNLWITILFAISAITASAKDNEGSAEIYGKVREKEISYTLDNAAFSPTVLLVTFDNEKPDSTYTIPDRLSGVFKFKNIIPQKIYLRISCVGRKTIEGMYDIAAGRNVFYFEMEDAPEKIDEAKVTAEVPLMKQIGDTLVYNSAAVTTMDGENLRAVLEQLPGFKVTRKGISVGGKEIKRTYVNGVLIFGDNPITAADALKADEVSQIRVYDEQNAIDKRKGLKHSKKDRVMDIVTKKELLHLTNAAVLLEGGADETGQLRYSGAAGIAYYSEMLQISGYGYAENTNVGSGDFMVDTPQSFILHQESRNNLDSYAETAGAQITVDKYWKDRDYGNHFSGGYSYDHLYRKSAEQAISDYFANGGNPAMTTSDTTSYRDISGTHSASMMFELLDTPLKSWFINVFGSISDKRNATLTASETVSDGSSTILSRHETANSDSRNYDVTAMIRWNNYDAVKVRPGFDIDFRFANSDYLSWTVDTVATSFDRRNLNSDGFGRSIDASARIYLGSTLINNEQKTLSLDAGVTSTYNRSKNKTMTMDMFGDNGPAIDVTNTYDNTWNNLTTSLYGALNYNTRNISVNGRIALQHILLMDDENFPQPPYSLDESTWSLYSNNRNYWTIVPSIEVRYKSFIANYSVSTSSPSSEQTRNRISDTNPLVLTGGNPELVPSYNTRMKLQWTKILNKGMSNIFATLTSNCNFRPIVQKTTYFTANTILPEWNNYEALAGSMLHTYENAVTPAWNVSLNVTSNILALKRKLRLFVSPAVAASSAPQYYGTGLISVNDINAGVSLNMEYRPVRALKFTLGGRSYYISSWNKDMELLSKRINSSANCGITANFLRNGAASINYKTVFFNYLGGIGSDFDSHSLDAKIEWKFLKKSLTVMLKAIDILNTGSVYTNIVTADAAVQTWKPIYGRYFMLGLAYNFRRK